MKTFSDASYFLETFIRDLGVVKYSANGYVFPSGEMLYRAAAEFPRIRQLIMHREDAIVRKLGDRREQYCFGPIDCTGFTSHSCGLTLMQIVLDESAPTEVDLSTDWSGISKRIKELFADAERPWSPRNGPESARLADGIRFERTAVFAERAVKGRVAEEDQKRFDFYAAFRQRDSRVTYKTVAAEYEQAGNGPCDCDAMKQSVYRIRKAMRNGT